MTQIVGVTDLPNTSDTPDTAAATDRHSARFGVRGVDGLRQVAVLLSWVTVYFFVVMVALAGLIAVTTGWEPVIVTSGSMSPALNPGDVLFVADHPSELVGQNAIVMFERDGGELVTHRVFATLPEQAAYVTKGDANPTPDTEIVPRDAVKGVGWLVVPYIGVPTVWLAEGNIAAIAALGLLGLLAISTIVVTSARRGPRDERNHDRHSTTAQRGVNRVRVVVGAILAVLAFVNSEQFDFDALGLSGAQTLTIALAGLAAVGALSSSRTHRETGRHARRLAVVELIGDTVVIVFVVVASGTASAGWILMALPIIEAAIHFRLTGAFIHWIVMSAMSVSALFFDTRARDLPQSETLARLEQLVDRLGVLLLVVIPASYLAEQLLGDVLANRRATRRAEDKTTLIEKVTTAGSEVARLDVDVFPALVASALQLGFDAADCWSGNAELGWKRLAQAGDDELELPPPGGAGSGLRPSDLRLSEVYIDEFDPDHEAASELAESGFTTLMRVTMADLDSVKVVLRVGSVQSVTEPAGQGTAFSLLAAQAAVALQNGQLLNEVRDSHAKIEHQARHDSLTDLPNRSYFTKTLADTVGGLVPGDDRTQVMFLDLNGFKAVNDRLGHGVGDELLCEVADRLRSVVGSGGMLARLGGDEFTILLVDEDDDAAADVIEQIHTLLSEPFTIENEPVRISTSVGIARCEHGLDVSELLRRSDVAMYAAKQSGGVRRSMRYHPDLDEEARRRDALESTIVDAISTSELHLVYQPIVTADTGEIVGSEVLLRWTHPEFGRIAPNEIIEIAESAGQVDELNAWIARRAMCDMADCMPRRIGEVEPFVAINVSPREVALGSLVANLQLALDESGLLPTQVIIELSEHIALQSFERIPNVDVLVDKGMRVALDDFGQGHTSLAHLRELPISCLKIDRSLLVNADDSKEDYAILRSIVSLAHDLGYSVIAEGVETEQQLAMVRSVEAQYVQGFGLHEPMPLDELAALFAAAASTAASDGSGVPTSAATTAPSPTAAGRPVVPCTDQTDWIAALLADGACDADANADAGEFVSVGADPVAPERSTPLDGTIEIGPSSITKRPSFPPPCLSTRASV